MIKDFENIFFIYSGGLIEKFSPEMRETISPKSLFKKIFKILKITLKDILFFIRPHDTHHIGKNWIFIISNNNYESLAFLKKNSRKFSFLYPKISIDDSEKYKMMLTPIYYKYKFIYDILFPFFLLYIIVYSKKRAYFLKYFDLTFNVPGYYFESIRILKKQKPNSIIFSNDHVIVCRALLVAANSLKIKTIYIQHASVSEYFPPLEFSLSLLEGQDALDKLSKIKEIKGEVKFIGIPKFDKYINQINTRNKIRAIGIAYNTTDNIKNLQDLIFYVQMNFAYEALYVRPHPLDNRILNDIDNIKISDSKIEDSFSFLNKIDFLISGDSNIHLEATIMNVVSIYFKLADSNITDYYGFVKNGLVDYVQNKDKLKDFLNSIIDIKPNVVERAKYYNDVIGTDNFGKSSDLALKFIYEHIE